MNAHLLKALESVSDEDFAKLPESLKGIAIEMKLLNKVAEHVNDLAHIKAFYDKISFENVEVMKFMEKLLSSIYSMNPESSACAHVDMEGIRYAVASIRSFLTARGYNFNKINLDED